MSKPFFTEQWVTIFHGLYEVSNIGRVRRIKSGRILKQAATGGGYLGVTLSNNKTRPTARVHKLVAEAFLGKRPDGKHINHLDGNKTNNRLSNLEYVTPKENHAHAVQMGLKKINANQKLSEEQVRWVKEKLKEGEMSARAIGEIVGVTEENIFNIKHKRTWINV